MIDFKITLNSTTVKHNRMSDVSTNREFVSGKYIDIFIILLLYPTEHYVNINTICYVYCTAR